MQSLEDARAGGYSLGVKLVRGAYHPFEVGASPSPEACPVWTEKKDTDACYNKCVGILLSALKRDIAHELPQLGIFFGTHNSQSCDKILEGLVQEGIAGEENGLVIVGRAAAERCAIGQLFGVWASPSKFCSTLAGIYTGMSDTLTNRLVDRIRSPSPFVIKWVKHPSSLHCV